MSVIKFIQYNWISLSYCCKINYNISSTHEKISVSGLSLCKPKCLLVWYMDIKLSSSLIIRDTWTKLRYLGLYQLISFFHILFVLFVINNSWFREESCSSYWFFDYMWVFELTLKCFLICWCDFNIRKFKPSKILTCKEAFT